jgi:hypothetical protein
MPCECDDGCERRCSLRGRDAVGRTGMTKLMAPPGDAVTGGLLVDPTTQSGFVGDRRCCARADVRRCGSPVDHAVPGGGCGSGRCRIPRSAALRVGGRLGGRRSTSQAGEGAHGPAPRSAADARPARCRPGPSLHRDGHAHQRRASSPSATAEPALPDSCRMSRPRLAPSVTVGSDDVLTTSGWRLSVDRQTDRHRVGGRIPLT